MGTTERSEMRWSLAWLEKIDPKDQLIQFHHVMQHFIRLWEMQDNYKKAYFSSLLILWIISCAYSAYCAYLSIVCLL